MVMPVRIERIRTAAILDRCGNHLRDNTAHRQMFPKDPIAAIGCMCGDRNTAVRIERRDHVCRY